MISDASTRQLTRTLIGALDLFGTPECVAAATPFLCVYLFEGVCDSSGVLYLPTMEECEELSNGVCRMEFELARSVGIELVDCSQLPRESPSLCNSSQSNNTSDENSRLMILIMYTEHNKVFIVSVSLYTHPVAVCYFQIDVCNGNLGSRMRVCDKGLTLLAGSSRRPCWSYQSI